MNTHWQAYPVPPMRHEAWFGDRIVPAFTPRWITLTPLGKFTTTSNVPPTGPPKSAATMPAKP